jgi:hypothetical protein
MSRFNIFIPEKRRILNSALKGFIFNNLTGFSRQAIRLRAKNRPHAAGRPGRADAS